MKELSPWPIRRMPEPADIQPEYGYVPQEEEVHLSHYWNILVKHRRIIILIFLLVFAVGSYFTFNATKLYTASAVIKIEAQHPQVTGVKILEPLETSFDYYPTQFALLRNRVLAARVITDLNLGSNKAFTDLEVVSPNPVDHVKSWMSLILRYFTSFLAPFLRSERSADEFVPAIITSPQPETEPKVPPSLVDQYLGFINVAPIQGTRLVRVQFTTPDPSLSQALTNAHVESFIRMSLESRFNLTKEAREFLNDKILELRQQLEVSEAALNKFRRAHGVVSIERGENIVVDRLVDLNRQLTAARAQRIEAESLYRTVEDKNYQDLAEVMRQGIIQQLKGNVASLEAEQARVSTIFKPDHPRIQELGQQIAAARQALNNEIANVVRGIRSSYTATLARERGLEAEANKQQQDALKLKELAVQYTVLQEEVNAHRSLYENVVKRLSETSLSSDLAVSNMQIAERADRPRVPSAPNPSLYLLASIISGLFFGVGIAFVREYFDSTVSTPEDVRRSVGLGTLGVVPHLKFLDRRSLKGARIDQIERDSGKRALTTTRATAKELIVNHSPISVISESYRTIRAALLLSQADRPPQVVLLTSPAPGEGKTTTTLNLSIALAQDGYSVLVIDADMRKGSCHARLGLRNNRGLSNALAGGLSLKDGIQATSVSGLYLLSRGIIPPNPSELLGSAKMKEILRDLRHTFKFILIDSPPAVAVSDAAVLSVLCDGVLLVLDGQKTSTPSAQKAVERLDVVRAPLLGVILNGVNLDDPHYSYYRMYSSYYAYEPNADDASEETNGDFSDAESGRSWTIGEESKGPDSADQKKSGTATGRNRGETLSTARNTTGFEEAPMGPRNAPSTEERSPETTLSQESLIKLIAALTNAIGPVASLVVREQITALGEPQSAFPKSRIGELLKLIQREITKDELTRFKATIPEEFRHLTDQ